MARFIPVVRSFVPVVAGVVKMPYQRFMVYNLGGALMWAVGILTAGYFLGGVPMVAAHVELITIAMAGLSLVPASIAFVRHRTNRTNRTRKADTLTSDELAPVQVNA